MVRESVSKIKNGMAAGPSGVVSEMVKTAGKARGVMITELVNQVKVGFIPAELELSTVVTVIRETVIL